MILINKVPFQQGKSVSSYYFSGRKRIDAKILCYVSKVNKRDDLNKIYKDISNNKGTFLIMECNK